MTAKADSESDSFTTMMRGTALAAVGGMGESHHLLFHMFHDALRYILKSVPVKSYDIS